MALTITATDSEVSKPVNVMMSETFLRRASQTLPYLVGSKPGQVVENGGTASIKWRRHEQLAPSTTALTELTTTASFGMGRDAVTPSVTDTQAAVSKYGQYFYVNEEVDLFNPTGTMMELTDVLGEAAGRSLNQLQRDEIEENSTQRFAGNVASDGAVVAAVTAGDLQRSANELWRNSARRFTPMTTGSQNIGTSAILPSYWAICHPDVAHDVAGITGFVSVQNYAGQIRTATGEFGYYDRVGVGVRFIASEDASIDSGSGGTSSGTDLRATSGSVDLYTIVILGQEAHGAVSLGQSLSDGIFMAGDDVGDWEMIIHPRGSGGIGDPFNEVSTMAYKFWHGSAMLNTSWSRAIRVGATNLSN